MEKNRNRIPIDTMTRPTQPIQQPDRPELLTISVGELAWVLTGWIDKTELRQGERIIRSPKKEQMAAESMFAKIKEMRTHFAEIQRQRGTER